MDKNEIESIDPDAFVDLSNLKRLALTYNHLTWIDPNAFKGLDCLNKLCLNYNQIQVIKSNTDLRTVKKGIQANSLNGLTNLEELDLSGNLIGTIDTSLFLDLPKITYLGLQNNKITSIESDSFKGLFKLENLNLENNRIENIQMDAFVDLSNLKELILENNALKQIDQSCFRNLKTVALINIGGNLMRPEILSFLDRSRFPRFETISFEKNEEKDFLSDWKQFLSQFSDFEGLFLTITIIIYVLYQLIVLIKFKKIPMITKKNRITRLRK